MANTGYISYSTLEEVYVDTGSPTGATKTNTIGDPDYVAPFYDPALCPPPTPSPANQGTITVIVVNNSSGSVSISNLTVKPQTVSNTYVQEIASSYIAGQEIIYSTANQLDIVSEVSFSISQLTVVNSCKIQIQYKNVPSGTNPSDVAYTTLITIDDASVLQNILASLLATPFLNNSTSYLQIVFTNGTHSIVPPNINAGVDQTITIPTTSSVTLTATTTDMIAPAVQWIQLSGAAATIASPTSYSTSVTGLNSFDTYIFQVTATNTEGLQSSDTVAINTVLATGTSGTLTASVDSSVRAKSSIQSITLVNVITNEATVLLNTPLTPSTPAGVVLPVAFGKYLIKVVTFYDNSVVGYVQLSGTAQITVPITPQIFESDFPNVTIGGGTNVTILFTTTSL